MTDETNYDIALLFGEWLGAERAANPDVANDETTSKFVDRATALTEALARSPAADAAGMAFKVFVLAHWLAAQEGWPAGPDPVGLAAPGDDGPIPSLCWSLVLDAARLAPSLAPLVAVPG